MTYSCDAPEIAFSTGKLTSISSTVSTTSYTGFDALGHSYGYDAENRMVSYDDGQPNVNPTAAHYSYDGDGRRVKAETASGVTVFVYDVTGKLVAEYSNAA